MKSINQSIQQKLIHKKIGIWGFGVVGQSALSYLDQFELKQIEILNNTTFELPTTKNKTHTIIQNESTIQDFLNDNDYIVVSPGIPLHDYQAYKNKFISELDLFYENNQASTIAITGSLGKTSITHLLSNILIKNNIKAVAAGNIGYPMLSLVTEATDNNNQKIDRIVLELSSFQLNQAQFFVPDLAIITNVYDNHLDHHKSVTEYFDAKCNVFRLQKFEQKALLPSDILPELLHKFTLQHNWSFFCATKPTQEICNKLRNNSLYYLENKIIYKIDQGVTTTLFDNNQLEPITFETNLLIIIASLDLLKVSLESLPKIIADLNIPDHRLQKIASINGSDFYNDSKSTVWQATLQAVNCMDNKPIKLFLGGLSKGADRTPLLQALAEKNIEIYAFGKEAENIKLICSTLNIVCYTHTTLQESFDFCMHNITEPTNILFSPGGSSYDLFDNYIQRGECFTQLVKNFNSLI